VWAVLCCVGIHVRLVVHLQVTVAVGHGADDTPGRDEDVIEPLQPFAAPGAARDDVPRVLGVRVRVVRLHLHLTLVDGENPLCTAQAPTDTTQARGESETVLGTIGDEVRSSSAQLTIADKQVRK
jgi:hypothetical protein